MISVDDTSKAMVTKRKLDRDTYCWGLVPSNTTEFVMEQPCLYDVVQMWPLTWQVGAQFNFQLHPPDSLLFLKHIIQAHHEWILKLS